MQAATIRIYKAVHTWTGIVAGMALFIAFYAGAITMFKEPLARWVAPPPDAGAAAVPLEDAPALIARALAERPAIVNGFRIHLQPAENFPARLTWQEDMRGAAAPAQDRDRSFLRHYSATLAPDGSLRVHALTPSGLAHFIDTLHRVVGLPVDNDENRLIMGVIATLYAVALVSGVIVLLPSLVKDFFALRLGRNLKRMWLDAHNVAGIISLPFHVVMVLTAAVFAFHDGIYFLQDKLIHGGRLEAVWRSAGAPPAAGLRDPATMLPPAELAQRVRAIAPTFEPTALQYQRVASPRASVRVLGHDATGIARTAHGGFATLDPYSGAILDTDYLPGHQGAARAAVSSFFTLHFGSFGGNGIRWAYFLLGLVGAFVFYSGNLVWIESRRRSLRGQQTTVEQTPSSRRMAAATVGVCLGCVIGISLTIAAGKWLHGRVADLDAWHVGVYYAAFFAAVAWAFARGAPRSAAELLWTAAAATAAIPATSLLGAFVPATGLWAHGSAAVIGVDLVAAAGAGCFALMARSVRRRMRHGRADSVWSTVPPSSSASSTSYSRNASSQAAASVSAAPSASNAARSSAE